MWKKIERDARGSGVRTGAAIQKNKTATFVVLPGDLATAARADFFSDGTRIAIKFSDSGGYAVFKPVKATSRAIRVSIPAAIKSTPAFQAIPYGTHDVEVTHEDGMIVVDLTQFKDAVAAE